MTGNSIDLSDLAENEKATEIGIGLTQIVESLRGLKDQLLKAREPGYVEGKDFAAEVQARVQELKGHVNMLLTAQHVGEEQRIHSARLAAGPRGGGQTATRTGTATGTAARTATAPAAAATTSTVTAHDFSSYFRPELLLPAQVTPHEAARMPINKNEALNKKLRCLRAEEEVKVNNAPWSRQPTPGPQANNESCSTTTMATSTSTTATATPRRTTEVTANPNGTNAHVPDEDKGDFWRVIQASLVSFSNVFDDHDPDIDPFAFLEAGEDRK